MINLYKQSDIRTKSKTMFPVNKSHIASMNLRLNTEVTPPEPLPRQPLRNTTNRIDQDNKPKSGHKYKKSLILHETTIQLVKKNSEIKPKEGTNTVGMSTERFSKERKRSIDCGAARIKTEMDEGRGKQERQEATVVQIGVDELREMIVKLRSLKSEKQSLRRQLCLFKQCFKKSPPLNSVLRALAPL